METWCIIDPSDQSCPVHDYLKSIQPQASDKKTQINRKNKLLGQIYAYINKVCIDNGLALHPAKPCRGYPFLEIRLIKDATTLIRIIVFQDLQKLILAYIFEKPKHYDTSKIKRQVAREYEIAYLLYKLYQANPSSIEPYRPF